MKQSLFVTSIFISIATAAQILPDNFDWAYASDSKHFKTSTVEFNHNDELGDLTLQNGKIRFSIPQGLMLDKSTLVGRHLNDRLEGPVFYSFEIALPKDEELGIACKLSIPTEKQIENLAIGPGSEFLVSNFLPWKDLTLRFVAQNKAGQALKFYCDINKTDLSVKSNFYNRRSYLITSSFDNGVRTYKYEAENTCRRAGYLKPEFRQTGWSELEYWCAGISGLSPSFKELSNYFLKNGMLIVFPKTRIKRVD